MFLACYLSTDKNMPKMNTVVTSSKQHKKPSLEEAFQAFNQVSQHLTDSYQQLEQQVVVLNEALKQSNSEKIQYLSDKDALASQLEGLIEAIPGALIVLDEQQKIVKVNACARHWFGNSLLGQQWSQLRSSILTYQGERTEQFVLHNGKTVALSMKELSGQSGQVVLLSDITHQQELTQQLEHKKKLADMGQFSASLAHQIRTPLASALLYASQLSSDTLNAEAQQKFSTKLLDRLRVLNSQVTDMLNYSHSGDFVKQPNKLTAFVHTLKDLYHGKKVYFDMGDFSEATAIYISHDALIGAISNLLDNALEASGSNNDVLCSIQVIEDNNLKIVVKDQGRGLSFEQQEKIFKPFYTDKTNGTGLGLAVVSNVVNAHKGRVKCESNIGVGTTMEVQLPVVISIHGNNAERS